MEGLYRRAFGLGFVSGLRSLTGPAALRLARGDAGSLALCLLAAGELVADKFPGVPARTSLGPLAFRVASGVFVGLAIARSTKAAEVVKPALCGALGAIAGSYAGHAFRRRAAAATSAPDFVLALGEDALAIWLGLRLRTTRGAP